MQSVCILAHDQYGNYVIQVLLLINFLFIFLLDFMLEFPFFGTCFISDFSLSMISVLSLLCYYFTYNFFFTSFVP